MDIKLKPHGKRMHWLPKMGITFVLGLMAIFMWRAFDPDDSYTSNKYSVSDTSGPATKIARLVPVPSASLNPAFRDDYKQYSSQRPALAEVPLSGAGYPIIVVRRPVPACSNPFKLQLASDMAAAGRLTDVDKVPSCYVLPTGAEAEWTKLNVLNEGFNEVRVTGLGPVPMTLVVPTRDGSDQPFFGWFQTLAR